jgi:spore coat polysaccharide biosynthesis protein SpsF (cytidylyltransferase family)
MAARVLAVIQARLGSTRLPGKTLADIAGRPMLAHVVERARAIPGVDEVVLATTEDPRDDDLARWAARAGLRCVRGSEEDVLDRFHLALGRFPADAAVRVTPDCPLLDPEVSGLVVAEWRRLQGRVEYVSNVDPPTFPDGLDTEIFTREALETAWREATLQSDREHVTPYLRRDQRRFRRANVEHDRDLSMLRWTVDTAPDLDFVRAVYSHLSPTGARTFGMNEVLALLAAHPELPALNAGQRRNQGYERSLAQDAASRRGPHR